MLYLIFYCGNDCFALNCDQIVEVFPKVLLNKIPGHRDEVPPYLVGLFNYGGRPIPVFDLCLLIEKRPVQEALNSRLVLLENGGKYFALLAEKVIETMDLEPTQFIPSGLALEALPFLNGVYSQEERSIQLFELERFMVKIQPLLGV